MRPLSSRDERSGCLPGSFFRAASRLTAQVGSNRRSAPRRSLSRIQKSQRYLKVRSRMAACSFELMSCNVGVMAAGV